MAIEREDRDQSSLVLLEDVLIAFQKSLARVSDQTVAVSKEDPEILLGQRSLYSINSLAIELSAGLEMLPARRGDPDKIAVSFSGPSETRSKISFQVAAKPLEPEINRQIILTRYRQDKNALPENQFCVWVIDLENSSPVFLTGHPIDIHFISEGVDSDQIGLNAQTDRVGRTRFKVNPKAGTLKFEGGKKSVKMTFDLKKKWFVQAQTEIGDETFVSEFLALSFGAT